MIVYKNQKANLNFSETKVSSKGTEQVFTSKIKSSRKNHLKKVKPKNKKFLEQLGFMLKEKT